VNAFGITVSLGTIALIYVVGAFFLWPPQSRLALLIFALAVVSLPIFGTLASGAATGIDTVDNLVQSVRNGGGVG